MLTSTAIEYAITAISYIRVAFKLDRELVQRFGVCVDNTDVYSEIDRPIVPI